MASRRVISLRSLGAAPLVGAVVYAADDAGSKKIKARDLPIYDTPETPKIIYINEKDTLFRQYVSSARQVVWQYADSMKETTDKVKYGYESMKKYGSDSLASVREDTAVLQRAALITVAGLGGVVAGYKGGALRKAVFAGTGMVATASIVYPNQAVDITSRNWDKLRAEGRVWWKQQSAGSTKAEETPKKVEKKAEANTTEKPQLDASKVDYGQSKAEDKDMYTTRG